MVILPFWRSMKTTLILLLCALVALPSCQTTGPATPPEVSALLYPAVTLAAAYALAKAEPPAQRAKRVAQLNDIAALLESLSGQPPSSADISRLLLLAAGDSPENRALALAAVMVVDRFIASQGADQQHALTPVLLDLSKAIRAATASAPTA